MSVIETLKHSLEVTQDHSEWYYAKACVRFLFVFHSNYGRISSRFATMHKRDRHPLRHPTMQTPHDRRMQSHLFHSTFAIASRVATHLSSYNSFTTMAIHRSIYLLTYLLTYREQQPRCAASLGCMARQ